MTSAKVSMMSKISETRHNQPPRRTNKSDGTIFITRPLNSSHGGSGYGGGGGGGVIFVVVVVVVAIAASTMPTG